MIGTVFSIALLRLWNNKQELLLAIVVPMLFFSIFALIFGSGVGSGTPAIKIAIVDDDASVLTAEIVRLLKEQSALQIEVGVLRTDEHWPLAKLTKAAIRVAGADVVIYLPAEMEQNIQMDTSVAVQLFSEGTNPVGRQIVSTMLSQVVTAALASSAAKSQLANHTEKPTFTRQVSRIPPPNLNSIPAADSNSPSLPPAQQNNGGEGSVRGGKFLSAVASNTSPASHPDHPYQSDLVSFEMTDVFAADKHNPKIAMYAAGIAVMFLLFSATGAGGSLLEEHEAGTLDRLLSSRLSVTELLAGKWLYITGLGCVQLTVMFVWAQVAFGVDLVGHIPGFAVMMLCTAAATASLALCLAVLCRSRAQLNGVSIVLILTMSALGGSMVPRYIMSEEMQRWGYLTFNAWALDGFKKVFWYDLPLEALATEITVLLGMAVGLACLARLFADRWAAN